MNLISLPKRLNSIADVNKALQDLEKVLNELLTSTNTPAEGDVSDTDGKTGDIRITQNEDKDYIFEVRAEDGWKTPVIGDSAVKFKEKPSASSKKQKKSIDELDAEDASTGGAEAQKTIYDEKADKFVIARPDYDSGWATWVRDDHAVVSSPGSREPLRFEHNLGAVPSLVTAYYAPDQAVDAVTWFAPIDNQAGEGYNNGIGIYVDNTTAYLYGGEDNSIAGMIAPTSSNLTTRAVFSDGSVRVLLWK